MFAQQLPRLLLLVVVVQIIILVVFFSHSTSVRDDLPHIEKVEGTPQHIRTLESAQHLAAQRVAAQHVAAQQSLTKPAGAQQALPKPAGEVLSKPVGTQQPLTKPVDAQQLKKPVDAQQMVSKPVGAQQTVKKSDQEQKVLNIWSSLRSKVAFGIKTGEITIRTRVPSLLQTWLQDIPNVLFISDFYGTVQLDQNHIAKVVDAVSWGMERARSAEYNNTIKYGTRVRSAGWSLNRYKHIPALALLLEHFPTAQWFVLVDDDTYIFKQNLAVDLLARDPQKHWYFGHVCTWNSSKPQANCKTSSNEVMFGHGGSGIVFSRTALEIAVGKDNSNVIACLDQLVGCSFGDVMLAECVMRGFSAANAQTQPTILNRPSLVKGIIRNLQSFKGDSPVDIILGKQPAGEPISWGITSLSTPIISLHRVSPIEYGVLWGIENSVPDRVVTAGVIDKFFRNHFANGRLKSTWLIVDSTKQVEKGRKQEKIVNPQTDN